MPDISPERRYGRFYLSLGLIAQNPNAVMAIMGKVIVIKADMQQKHEEIQYTAISDMFEPIDEGQKIPEYVFEMHKDEKEKIEVTKALKR